MYLKKKPFWGFWPVLPQDEDMLLGWSIFEKWDQKRHLIFRHFVKLWTFWIWKIILEISKWLFALENFYKEIDFWDFEKISDLAQLKFWKIFSSFQKSDIMFDWINLIFWTWKKYWERINLKKAFQVFKSLR